MVEEADAYVQGESLKASATLLREVYQLPGHQAGEAMNLFVKDALGAVAVIIVLAIIGKVTGITNSAEPSASAVQPIDKSPAKSQRDAGKPAETAPTPDDDSTLKASRTAFSDYCEDAIRSQLSMPASFDPSYLWSGSPQLVRWPDHTSTWTWTLQFKASNAYGAVGRYQGICSQNLQGEVVARISLAH